MRKYIIKYGIRWATLAAVILIIAVVCRQSEYKSNLSIIAEAYRSLDTADATGTIKSDVKLNSALVIFTFDDGNESDYLLAYPILQKYGIAGTSFINPYNSDNYIKNKLSWNEIKQMRENGWEFQDHTYTHIPLAGSTATQIQRSMEMVNYSFERQGLPIPDTIAYPYGDVSQSVIDIVKQYRKQARLAAATDAVVNLRHIDPYQLQCVSADMRLPGDLKDLEKLIDWACAEKVVVVFRTHCLYQNSLNDMGKQPDQADSKLFVRLVDYCVQKGCEFTTMDGLLNLYTEE